MQKMMAKNHGVESSGQSGGKLGSDSSPFDSFPEDCMSKIVSFTSPRDACVAAMVSKAFESAAKSDLVWEKFLPPEYESLVPSSLHFSSKKELYFAFCKEPVLFDNGTKSFWIEKASGKRSIMLSAINISLKWGDTPQCLEWITIPEARFKSVAKLRYGCWFDFRGRVKTCVLSPRTRYSAYLVLKNPYSRRMRQVGLESKDGGMISIFPEEREDGWMEVDLGGFFNGDEIMDGDEIEMSALETRDIGWDSGMIVQGMEIRPANIQ